MSTRHFITGTYANCIVIREVPAGSCALTFSREEAWAHANVDARPHKAAQDPKARVARRIDFVGLDMTTRTIKTAEAVQAEWEAANRTAAPKAEALVAAAEAGVSNEGLKAVARQQAQADAPKWIEQDPRNAEAAEYLHSLNNAGKLNDFTNSLLGQLERNGSLSDKQRDCLLKNRKPESQERPQQERPEVPAGRYAVENEEGELRFYKVDRPTEGKWAGYTFVKVQASDDFHPVRGKAAVSILRKIEADPQAAMLRYGAELGRCGHCNRTLTSEWRERGIGPVCAGNMGW